MTYAHTYIRPVRAILDTEARRCSRGRLIELIDESFRITSSYLIGIILISERPTTIHSDLCDSKVRSGMSDLNKRGSVAVRSRSLSIS